MIRGATGVIEVRVSDDTVQVVGVVRDLYRNRWDLIQSLN